MLTKNICTANMKVLSCVMYNGSLLKGVYYDECVKKINELGKEECFHYEREGTKCHSKGGKAFDEKEIT